MERDFDIHKWQRKYLVESQLQEEVKLTAEEQMIERFLKKLAKEMDYPVQDAASFVKGTIKKLGL